MRRTSNRTCLSSAPRLARVLLAALLAAAIVGCASGPQRSSDRDGPEANPPPDLARVPDAEPRLEPIRPGGPNKPYDALGRSYVPITQDAPFTERGLASWYGKKFHGRRTASGEVYNMYAMTAAHPTLPIPSYARVRNPANGREVVVRINDRGPFHGGRVLDLSYTAALKLDLLRGVGAVEIQRITFDDIRTGAWRRGTEFDTVRVASVDSQSIVRVMAGAADRTGAAAQVVSSADAAQSASSNSTPATTQLAMPGAPQTLAQAAPQVVAQAAPQNTPQNPSQNAQPTTSPAVSQTASQPSASAEPVADAPTARAFTTSARGFWVQLGAFRVRDGAETFQKRVSAELDWLSPLLAVFDDSSMFRLQAGPYPTRDEARGVAERVRDGLKLVPVIVERR